MTRITQRAGFDAPTRLSLLEQDADEAETALREIKSLLYKAIWAFLTLAGSIVAATVTNLIAVKPGS